MIERYESRLANSVYALYERSVKRKELYPFLDANLERMIPGLFNFLEEISDSNEFFEVISELDIALEKEFIDELLSVHVADEDMKFWQIDNFNERKNECLVHTPQILKSTHTLTIK